MPTSDLTKRQKRAADTIMKLLALAEDDGATRHEREVAEAKAEQLLSKHQLTREDIDLADFEIRTIELPYKRVTGWYDKLAVHVSKFLGVFVLYCKTFQGQQAKYRLSGRPQDIDIFEYMMANIKRQVYELASDWKEKQDAAGHQVRRADTNAFRHGVVRRIGQRLQAMLKDMSQSAENSSTDKAPERKTKETALTLTEQATAKRSKAKDFMANKIGGGFRTRNLSKVNGSGYRDGIKAGDKVTVRRAAKKTSETPQLVS